MLIPQEKGAYNCLAAHRKKDSSFPVAAETLEALGGTCLGWVHVHLCNFVFPCKIELHTVPVFGNTLIPCLTLD